MALFFRSEHSEWSQICTMPRNTSEGIAKQQQASRYLTRVKKTLHCSAAEGKQHWRLGEWLQNSSIFRERGKKLQMSRTAAAEQCCFLGDGKCVFRFILKGRLLLFDRNSQFTHWSAIQSSKYGQFGHFYFLDFWCRHDKLSFVWGKKWFNEEKIMTKCDPIYDF